MSSLFKQQYTTKGKNGKRVKKKARHWYFNYKNADGIRKRVKAFKDKAASQQLKAELERKAELARAGIIDKYEDHRKRKLLEHLDDYRMYLESKGASPKHTRLTIVRARSVITECGFAYIGDVSASRVQKYLGERKRQGLGIKTCNYYLQAVKQFFNWMVDDRRIGENPLAHLNKQNAKTDVRYERRALSEEDIERLLTTTAKGPVHHNMPGSDRAMLYMLVLNTGFRASEAASLTWSCFDFDKETPSVTVCAAYSKHRKEDRLPLRPDIAQVC